MGFERGCQRRAARQRPKHTRAERDRWGRAAGTIRRRARGGRGSIILRLTRPGRRRPCARGGRRDGGTEGGRNPLPISSRRAGPGRPAGHPQFPAGRPGNASRGQRSSGAAALSASPARLAEPARGPVRGCEPGPPGGAASRPAAAGSATRCCLINVQIE